MRHCSLLLLLCLLLGAAAVRAERIFEIKGTVMVPVRYVADWVGATMTTNAQTKVTTLTLNKQVSTLKVGNPAITIAGKAQKLAVAPSEAKGVLYAPAQALALAFGLKATRERDDRFWMEVTVLIREVAVLTNLKTGKKLKLPIAQDDDTTPLHLDVHNGLTSMVMLHLARGLSIESTDSEQRTPLMYAAALGNAEMVNFLLSKGASVKARSKYGETPLLAALRNGSQTMARTFLDKGAPGDTEALALAAAAGAVDIVRRLLDTGVPVNPEDPGFNNVPLRAAAGAGNLEIVDLLLAKGAKTDLEGPFGETPLLGAMKGRQVEIVTRLLEKGAKVNLVSKAYGVSISRSGRDISLSYRLKHISPILYAAMNGNLEIVEAVLKFGADVKQVNYDGLNALHCAAMTDSENGPKIIETLAAAGAAITEQPDDFKLDISHGNVEKPLKLRALSPLHLGVLFRADEEDGIYRRVRTLLAHGADVKAKASDGYTALHLAALRGADADTLAALVKAGAEINGKTDDGLTPLKIAVTYGEKDAAVWLRARGGTE